MARGLYEAGQGVDSFNQVIQLQQTSTPNL